MNTDNTLGTIFIVGDMQENVRILTQVLIDHNYKVRECWDNPTPLILLSCKERGEEKEGNYGL